MAKEIKRFSNKKSLIIKLLFIVVLAAALAGTAYFYVRYRQVNNKYHEAIMTQDERNQKTINEVSKVMALPSDENPTIFLVQDKDKLGGSNAAKQFFASTINGDVILAYEKANLSIIYRPSEKRIIKTDNYTNFLAAANTIKIAIIAYESQQSDTETLILEKVLNVEIVSKQIPKVVPSKSYVADVSGQNTQAAQELAAKLSLSVGSLPEGETQPEGATLVVVIAPVTAQP